MARILVSQRSQVNDNLRRLAKYLATKAGSDAEYAEKLIKDGICFVVIRLNGSEFFGPSRFVGYVNNSRRSHVAPAWKSGGETNRALNNLAGSEPKLNPALERKYRAFCAKLGITPRSTGSFGEQRKYWDLR